MTAAGAAVTIENLTVAYERHPALHHITGRFAAGSLTAIVGPNGAGKSTLIKAIAGALRPSGGRIERDDARIAYLPQQSEIERSFPITVLDTVLLGLWRRIGWRRGVTPEQSAAATDALHAVGLGHFEARPISTLSAGQFQRVLFARLILQDAPLILLDEPFTALDTRTTRDLLGLVAQWHREGRTVIAVLHDFEQVRAHFPDTLLLARELVAWGPTADVMTADNLAAARDMAEAWDEAAHPLRQGWSPGMIVYDWLVQPFVEFGFMRRALVAAVALGLGSGPIGTFLVLRRMSLMGDAMSHAVLPGAAIGFLLGGLSLPAMSLGGLAAGLIVALLSGIVTRLTPLREDASFAAFYLISLALGVLIVSTHGSNVDLLHVLFGTILAVDNPALLLVAGIATVTLIALALAYRPLVLEAFDPGFLRSVGVGGGGIHALFLTLVRAQSGRRLPGARHADGGRADDAAAAAARFWAREVWSLAAVSTAIACLAGYLGLLGSYYLDWPSGPAIILTAGAVYALSVLFGRRDSIRTRYLVRRHLAA